ncbi:MAG: sugar ABC transporter permease [Spirochaetaceae bacterium]|nr:sugar ABC transporter permease [Spirochaetaceae bacterium]RKX81381.1 MAG: sugar ABC transporter permease [Spirochaetota bacterium]RKX85839.1 MAG: sugar ABC transporter permease [Spirochaetota bacterium]RKX97038.1 MAG: sugar ABC transporter permease [Spirochaetota bacterium]
MKSSSFKNPLLPYVLLIPTFLILVVFLFYPAFETFRLSLFKVHPYSGAERFAGFYNFKKIFTNPEYLSSFWRSLVFAVTVVIIGLMFSLFVAVLLNQKARGMKLYRSFLIWPYALSPAIAGALFNFLFNPANGLIGYFTGVRTWLTDSSTAMFIIIIAAVWKNLGYNIVFYLTALRNVPTSALEAAAIDGAGPVRRFFSITFTYLSPITFFLMVMNTTYAYFACFGLIDVLTEGGPAGSTQILIYQLYKDFFVHSKIGYAAAESLILFLLVVGITMLQFQTTEKKVHYQ